MVTTVVNCDDCNKPIVILSKSIGDLCVGWYCTVCAKGNITTHDQGKFDDEYGCPRESMAVGVRIARIEL